MDVLTRIWEACASLSAEALISMLVGALITWFFAWFYFKRAGDELRKEAADLRRLTAALLQEQKHPGTIERVDEHGRIVDRKLPAKPGHMKLH